MCIVVLPSHYLWFFFVFHISCHIHTVNSVISSSKMYHFKICFSSYFCHYFSSWYQLYTLCGRRNFKIIPKSLTTYTNPRFDMYNDIITDVKAWSIYNLQQPSLWCGHDIHTHKHIYIICIIYVYTHIHICIIYTYTCTCVYTSISNQYLHLYLCVIGYHYHY